MTANFSIPIQKRTRKAQWITFFLALTLFLIGAGPSVENKYYTFCILNVTCYSSIIIAAETIYRLILLSEEISHVPSRYETVLDVFIKTFKFSSEFLAVIVSLLFILLYILVSDKYMEIAQILASFGWPSHICNIIGAVLLITLLRPKYGPLYESLSIYSNGLDYGSAMAHSFFHGYLEIVLPNKGSERKGIKEHIYDFASKHQVHFDCDRLLVLIPLSLHCPPSMEEKSEIVEKAQSFGEIQIDRAGINKRSYKNTAYKIIDEKRDRKVYVSAEYATPLRTLLDITRHRSEHAAIYERQQKELVLQFYLTLQNILNNDPDCKNCCDLIFFDDTDDSVDVGKVVLEHLERNGYTKKNV